MSNLALVRLVIPIAGTFAQVEGYSILALTSGIALAASCAFMLPVATPPNAILYSSNLIPIRSMVRIGLYMNLIVTVLITLIILLIFGTD
jgi:solute carrier family 13 (sodium-dependent dicarboxylate transporter), member 2/3/5